MPHYVRPPLAPTPATTTAPGEMAHGLIIAKLRNKAAANGVNARAAVLALNGTPAMPPGLQIVTVSQMTDEGPGGGPGNAGEVVVAFVNTTDPMRSPDAHQHMDALAVAIAGIPDPAPGGQPYFMPNPEHY